MRCYHCGLKDHWRGSECPGPPYPTLPGLAKYRRIKDPSPADRRAHGDAVHAAVRALQRRELLGDGRTGPDLDADLAYRYRWSPTWKPRRYMD